MKKNSKSNYGKKNNYKGSGDYNQNRDRRCSGPKDVGIVHTGPHRKISDVNGSANSPEWYKDTHGVVEDSARIATYYPIGIPNLPYTSRGAGTKYSEPVGISVGWLPLPAVSSDATSPISIAAQVIMQQIKKVLNKPVLGYQPADPVIAYIAFLSMVTLSNEIHRDYALMNAYSTENLAYPKGVLSLLGYNDKSILDLRNNMAEYRQRFNLTLYQMSSIFMPFETNILEKYKWLSSGIFRDHDNIKGQLYMYALDGVYQWDETSSDQGSQATFVEMSLDTRKSKDQLMKYKLDLLDQLVISLRSSDSWNAMVSDLQRAFPDAQTYSFPLIEENEMPNIYYNETMLEQFENLYTTPWIKYDVTTKSSLNVTQDVNNQAIICEPALTPASYADPESFKQFEDMLKPYLGMQCFNFSKIEPSTDDIIENVVAKTIWFPLNNKVHITAAAAGVVYTGFVVCVPKRNGTDAPTYSLMQFNSIYKTIGDATEMVFLTHCNHAPYVWTEKNYDLTLIPFGETNNMVPCSEAVIGRMFDAMSYSMWNIPNNVITGQVK